MPVKDRLAELQRLQEDDNQAGMWTMRSKADKSQKMQEYLQDASQIDSDLAKMKADVAELDRVQKDLFSLALHDREVVSKHEALFERARLSAMNICESLKQLEKRYHQEPGPSGDGVFRRVRAQQLSALTTSLNVVTNEFFALQAEYADRMKSRLRRQLSAKGEPVDDSNVNIIMDENSYSVFTENYITDVHNAEQTLRDLEDRKKDILALEKSISGVNQMFEELNLMISAQGETLDTIESNIEGAEMCVQKAHDDLGEAVKNRSKCRRKKCWLVAIVITVIVVVIVIVSVSLAS